MTSDARKRLAEQTADAHHIHPDAAVRDLIARERRAAAVEATREAADRWMQGEWSDAMLPKPMPPAVLVVAYSNRVGDWLRERADRLEAS